MIPSDCVVESSDMKDCRPAEYYLITYSVLLGELDDDLIRGIEDKVFALALFFCFSFIMAIVMLNILIAVISDSYEKSMLRSKQLFGLARVHQLAEILALQDLFRVREDNKLSNQKFICTSFQWTKGGFTFFVITAFTYFLWIVMDLRAEDSNMGFMSSMVFIFSLIMFCIFVVLLAGAAQTIESSVKMNNRFVKMIHEKIHCLMLRVLGKSQADSILHDQWSGRLVYIKREIAASTKRVQDSFQAFQKEIRSFDQERREFKEDISNKLQRLEEQIAQIVEMKTCDSESVKKQYLI